MMHLRNMFQYFKENKETRIFYKHCGLNFIKCLLNYENYYIK